MHSTKRILLLSIMVQISLSSVFVASVAARMSAAVRHMRSENISLETTTSRHRRRLEAPPVRLGKNIIEASSKPKRRLQQTSLETTDNSASADDKYDDAGQPTTTIVANGTAATTTQKANNELCTPMAECEMCPHNWKVLIEKEDEAIKGEYDSCLKYGRRRQFECTTLFQENESSDKIARSLSEYRPCRYTEADEQYRMLRMQMICLLIGMWSLRQVRRQKVVSASLFDQRRMRLQNAGGSGGNVVSSVRKEVKKYTALGSDSSMDTVELIPLTGPGAGKIPKSPAPNPTLFQETV